MIIGMAAWVSESHHDFTVKGDVAHHDPFILMGGGPPFGYHSNETFFFFLYLGYPARWLKSE